MAIRFNRKKMATEKSENAATTRYREMENTKLMLQPDAICRSFYSEHVTQDEAVDGFPWNAEAVHASNTAL